MIATSVGIGLFGALSGLRRTASRPLALEGGASRGDERLLSKGVDMVVVGTDSMEKPKADAFVKAVAATFYAVNSYPNKSRLARPPTAG